MKKILIVLIAGFTILSCKTNEPAEYVGVENVRVETISKGNVVLLADAKFYNPNHLGGKVSSIDIDVMLDDNKVAKVDAVKDFVVPRQDEFMIPLRMSIPLNELKKDKGLLGSIASAALSNAIEIDLIGDMKFDFKVMKYKYKIEEKKEFKLR